jgi:hypothetical protein
LDLRAALERDGAALHLEILADDDGVSIAEDVAVGIPYDEGVIALVCCRVGW